MNEVGTAQAARILNVAQKTVTRYCQAGLLEARRERRGWLGRYRWVIEEQSVERLLKEAKGH